MYKLVAIAGTFDRLHRGHRFFISEAFRLGEKVLIGLTSDEFADRKIKRLRHLRGVRSTPRMVEELVKPIIEGFVKRKKQLEAFLTDEGYIGRSTITKIDDVYGPAVENKEIEALVVTSDTLEGGRKVNRKRRSLGLTPLKLLQIPLIMAQDNERIASTRIRLGEIDRWGRAFAKQMQLSNFQFPISNKLRYELKKPLGILITGNPKNHKEILAQIQTIIYRVKPVILITVGDEVTKLCNESGINSDLSVIDFRVGRIKKYFSLSDLGFIIGHRVGPLQGPAVINVRNPAGNIRRSLVKAVAGGLKSYIQSGGRRVIKVLGEEDLAGVPAILLAPLGSLVLYGQPGEGIVAVKVTEEKKNELSNLF